MATISSVGIGSGLDAQSIVSKLVDLEKAPLKTLQTKATLLSAKVSVFGTIKSDISKLGLAAANLADPLQWSPVAIASSNTSAVSATFNNATGAAAPATYSVAVQQLAQAQTAASAVVTSGATVGTGSISIQLGSWSTGFAAFTPGSASAVSVTIDNTNSTLAGIASAINAASAGVTATVATDSSGQRLIVTSNATGAATGFRMQVTDDDATPVNNTGLSSIGFDPQTGAYGMGATISTAQLGQDAKATLNSVPVTSSTNTFATLVTGLSFTANQVTTAPVSLTVSADNTSLQKNVAALVSAYNTLATDLGSYTAYNAAQGTAGVLQGDAATLSLQTAIRNAMGQITSGGKFSRLSDIGVSFQRDGTMQLDSAKLSTALQNTAEVAKFFTTKSSLPATTGFAVKLNSLVQGMLKTGGAVVNKNTALQAEISNNSKQQTKISDSVNVTQARLLAQYSALDGKMASLTALSSYVNQQVTLWNKSTG